MKEIMKLALEIKDVLDALREYDMRSSKTKCKGGKKKYN